MRRQVEWSKEKVDFSSPAAIVGHTPGPWSHEDPGSPVAPWTIRSADGWRVAVVPPPAKGDISEFGGKADANARLIAAAPELLTEAKKTLRLLERVSPGLPTIAELRDLIARAEGRDP